MVKDNIFFQAKKWLSQIAVAIQPDGPYIQHLALINPMERELIGYCYAYIALFGKDNFGSWLETKAVLALKKIGMAKLVRTELTDLGFFIGNKGIEEITFNTEPEGIDIKQ